MQTGVICNTTKLMANGFGFIKPDNGKELPVWRIS
jgi:cold shock CspA family protein